MTLLTMHWEVCVKASHAVTTLEELGASQWGLITAAQAQAHGVSRVTLGRLREAGMVHPLRRGVYALPSSGQGPLQDLRAAWLATNPTVLAEDRVHNPGASGEVAVSHRSAAAVHGLGDVMPTRHEFTASGRRTSSHPDVAFHRQTLGADDLSVVDGLLVTSIERTVADLCGPGVDLDHFAEVVRDALANERVDAQRLTQALTPGAKRLGFPTGAALIEECLERAGLPTPVLNTLPLWHTTLVRQLQQAIPLPKMDFTALWPSNGVDTLPQQQWRQLQESMQQIAAEHVRVATSDIVKQLMTPVMPHLGLTAPTTPLSRQHAVDATNDVAESADAYGREGAA